MEEMFGKPKTDRPFLETSIETESGSPGALVVGEENPLAPALKEILSLKGIRVNNPQVPSYIFQLGDFGKTETLLKMAVSQGMKFFLIVDKEDTRGVSKKTEKITLDFFKTQKLVGKIIKLSGFFGQETEVAPKILEAAFSRSPERIVTLSGLGDFLGTAKTQLKPQRRENFIRRKTLFISWGVAIISLIFLLFLPVLFILFNIFFGALSLQNARQAVFSSAFEKGAKKAKAAEDHFAAAKTGVTFLLPVFRLLGQEDQEKEIEKWLDVGQNLGLATRHLVDLGKEGEKLVLTIFGQEQEDTREVLAKVSADTTLVEQELALIEASVTTQPPFFSESFQQVSKIRKSIINFKNFLVIAPWVLGVEEKRTFLLLFQNNFELRPGGGFIGTVGFLTLENGKADLKIEDVYTFDGQLKGHVEPPKPIRDYLNQPHWYLRDSNWESDFPTNARNASWFLEKEVGLKVDGVIALDLFAAQKILGLVGPIEVPDFQERITVDNFFLKTQIHSQEDFFPGSTQKKDFLGAVANALLLKLTSEKSKPTVYWFKLGEVLADIFVEKHLFVFWKNDLAEELVFEQGWGGEIRNVKCLPAEASAQAGQMSNVKCLDDYLMVVEANLGVNKANYFVKRQISKEVKFEANSLTTKITLSFENNSPANISFGGVYKNYLRVLTSEGFTLERIKIGGQEKDLNDGVDQEKVFGKNSTGLLVEIPPLTKKEVEISYRTLLDVTENELAYQLLVQKQPGTDKDPFSLQIIAPWQVMETNFPIAKNEGLIYNGDLSVDRIFKIRFKK